MAPPAKKPAPKLLTNRERLAKSVLTHVDTTATFCVANFDALSDLGMRPIVESFNKFKAYAYSMLLSIDGYPPHVLDPATPETEAINILRELYNFSLSYERMITRMLQSLTPVPRPVKTWT